MTGEDYKHQYLDSIRNEKRLTNIVTKPQIQPLCRATFINLRYSDGIRIFPRTVIGRNKAVFLHNNHFCLTWKSQRISFKQARLKLEINFKIDKIFITEGNVKSHFDYIYTP